MKPNKATHFSANGFSKGELAANPAVAVSGRSPSHQIRARWLGGSNMCLSISSRQFTKGWHEHRICDLAGGTAAGRFSLLDGTSRENGQGGSKLGDTLG